MAEKYISSVTLEGVRLRYPNFSGRKSEFNLTGKRIFDIVLPIDVAHDMQEKGWTVKWPKPYNDEDEPEPRIEVTVRFEGKPPHIALITGRGQTDLDKNTVGLLDSVVMINVDLTINPYYWSIGGKEGYRAYLEEAYITIEESRLQQKYADVPRIHQEADDDIEDD